MNMSKEKNAMPVQDPQARAKNFDEVALGYTEEQAKSEADRCLNCKTKPCKSGCPVGIDIPEFIQKIKVGDYEGAYRVISQSSSLAAVCGRVCPQETQCESKCVRGKNGEPVAIGRLERFVADWHNAHKSGEATRTPSNGHKVAVVGSGPAGLSCAGELAGRGYEVTVFEALHTAGGVLVYGIPEFRLPKTIVADEIENLKSRGVKFELNTVIGRTLFVDELFDDGFEAVFIGSGAGLPNFMRIKGEDLKGVYSANEFLTRVNLMKAYREDSATPVKRGKRVAVVGGGNVAMDAARCALRLGADSVTLVYRRSEAELPARKEEVEHAKEEGVEFTVLTAPVEVLGDEHKNVRALKCRKMTLGEPDASGRRRPVPIDGSDFELQADVVIAAIGTSPNPLIKNTTAGIDVQKWGGIITDENGATTRDMVYAGGDAVTGAATVILAMGAGKDAAEHIDVAIKAKHARR
ncbi:NADPH-dependent glutamate synthase [Anaerocaecibacter muris]|uniref:NADPH-dependent glutamate synthase n=1 Tax=Anaerocaecibacter muris TaxID=2941513 RepID=UPI003F68DE3F